MTSFNKFTFFQADINQSEVEDSIQLASDWIKSARKNVNKLKRSHFEGCPIHPHRNGPYKTCVDPYRSNGSTTGVYGL